MSARSLTFLAITSVCMTASVSATPTDNFLIVPGHRIGQTALGPNGAAELKHLPKPSAEDDGMMQRRLVWVSHTSGHADTLFIHTTANGAYGNVKPVDGVTIDTIRITSRQFHTRNGISTASTLAQIRRRFRTARVDKFNSGTYVDARQGISFELARPVSSASRCIGISIYPPSSGSDSAETDQSEVDDLLKDPHP